MKKHLSLIGLNYKTAPVDVRERFALTDPEVLANGVIPLDDAIHECMILSTCNRVEILTVTSEEQVQDRIAAYWAQACKEKVADLLPYIYRYSGPQAVNHLFTVASSLDSMVLGEPQILGQLKDAYRVALEKQQARVILNRLLHKAFSVAKRVRTETAVASSAVSISYAAVELAKRIFGRMDTVHVMLLGAGEMAELAATHLLHAGIGSIRVANRTHERAVQLARQYNGSAVLFSDLLEHLPQVDIVISSTGAPEPILCAQDIKKVLRKRKNNPMFFIDIAVPRDIDPDVNGLDNIYLYDIDDLKEVVEENIAHRREEAEKAADIVQEETHVFLRWLHSLDLQPSIIDLVNRAEEIAQDELERTLKRIGPQSPEVEEALEAMLNAVIKKMNHEPISYLKRRFQESQRGEECIHTVRRIFNLDKDHLPEETHVGRKCPLLQKGS